MFRVFAETVRHMRQSLKMGLLLAPNEQGVVAIMLGAFALAVLLRLFV